MQIVTHEFIVDGMTYNGAWTRKQLELLGVQWPPKKGWKLRCIGRVLSDEAAAMFLDLGDAQPGRDGEWPRLSVLLGERVA